MKKTIAFLLALLLLPVAGCAFPAGPQVRSEEPDLQNGRTLSAAVRAERVPLDAIQLPVHTLILAMVEHDLPYDDRDDDLVWTALYYTLSMYGQTDLRARATDEALLMPRECAQDFFHALFPRRTELPPVPPALADRVVLDEAAGEYRLALGDFGQSEVVLDRSAAGPGVTSLRGRLVDPSDGQLICSFLLTLEDTDSMFGYAVLDARIDGLLV